MSYDKQTAAFLAAIGEHMPAVSTKAMQYWIERKATALRAFLEDLAAPIASPEALEAQAIWPVRRQFLLQMEDCLPAGLTSDLMDSWLENKDALKKLLEGLCPPAKPIEKCVSAPFDLPVYYDKKIEEAIRAGNYGGTHEYFRGMTFFPLWEFEKGKRHKTFWFYSFDANVLPDYADDAITADGRRSSTLRELLATGEHFPKRFGEEAIMALGSLIPCNERTTAPCLSVYEKKSTLGLQLYDQEIPAGMRFLATA